MLIFLFLKILQANEKKGTSAYKIASYLSENLVEVVHIFDPSIHII